MSAAIIGWAAALGVGMGAHALGAPDLLNIGLSVGLWAGFTAGVYVRSQVRL